MDRETAAKLLEENLREIFAWSVSRLYDKEEAEDLTNDIICEVLRAVPRLESDDAFYGFMWKVAENVLRGKIRKKRVETVELAEEHCGVYWVTPEDEFIKSEQIGLLRRELALLSGQYRETTVQYYIYGKSCAEISTALNISVEMVKYYLFKTRKILKEGINMTREFGEKSYNPAVFRMNFWGDWCNYWEIFKRRLPGNILLLAYDKPISMAELSVELGVAAPYLEDEVRVLEKHEMLKKAGDKYRTNIIIFKNTYEKRMLEKLKGICAEAAEKFNRELEAALPAFRQLDFGGKDYSDNRLKWTLGNLALYHVFKLGDQQGREEYGAYPMLPNGAHGFVYGHDNDFENQLYHGRYGYCPNEEQTAWFAVDNYKLIGDCQNWQPLKWNQAVRAMTDAVLCRKADESNDELTRLIGEGFIRSEKGSLCPAFPVFDEALFEGRLQELLQPMIRVAWDCERKCFDFAAEQLKKEVPEALRDKCGQLAQIRYQMDAAALMIEALVAKGQLIIPEEKTPLCVFGVRKDLR